MATFLLVPGAFHGSRCRERLVPLLEELGDCAAADFGPEAEALPRAFVGSIDDRIMPLAFQRKMQALLPGDPVVTVNTDHSRCYSAPDALADAPGGIARSFAA